MDGLSVATQPSPSFDYVPTTQLPLFAGRMPNDIAIDVSNASLSSTTPATTTPLDENAVFDVGSAQLAFALTILMSVGIGLNCVLLLTVLLHPRVRQLVNAFVGHYAAISVLKCIFCIIFATSLTTRFESTLCDKIGGSYVVLTSIEVFNLLAMVCAEAYFFGQANVGRDGRGSCCCVLIGLFLIYLGSVILHLGPTIIAGGVGFNRTAGSCIFGYKSIQSYVAHAIWIVITTLGITAVLYYLSVVYREVQSCRPHRIASLVRASVPTTTRNQHTVDQVTVRRIVSDSQRRAVVLILVTCTFVITSYPLFLLTLLDIGFAITSDIYRVFTFFSWTNTVINPILFFVVDRKFGLFRLLKPCGSRSSYNNSKPDSRRPSSSAGNNSLSPTPPANSIEIPVISKPSILNSAPTEQPLTVSTVDRKLLTAKNTMSTGGNLVGSLSLANERTGLLSKSNDRLPNYDDDDDDANCSGQTDSLIAQCRQPSGKQTAANVVKQPPVVNQWQNRVGGRLYLQGELLKTNAPDESVMLVDMPDGNFCNLVTQHGAPPQRILLTDLMDSETAVGSVERIPGPSAAPQVPPRQTFIIHNSQQPSAVYRTNMAELPQGSIRNQNRFVKQVTVDSLASQAAPVASSMTTSPSLSPKRLQVNQQPLVRIYKPQSVGEQIDDVAASETSPSTMMLMAHHRQMQQEQMEMLQQSQLCVVPNVASNISYRQNSMNSSNIVTNSGRHGRLLTLANTPSFIGTEDSLEEYVYANSPANMYLISQQQQQSGEETSYDGLADEETTC